MPILSNEDQLTGVSQGNDIGPVRVLDDVIGVYDFALVGLATIASKG